MLCIYFLNSSPVSFGWSYSLRGRHISNIHSSLTNIVLLASSTKQVSSEWLPSVLFYIFIKNKATTSHIGTKTKRTQNTSFTASMPNFHAHIKTDVEIIETLLYLILHHCLRGQVYNLTQCIYPSTHNLRITQSETSQSIPLSQSSMESVVCTASFLRKMNGVSLRG